MKQIIVIISLLTFINLRAMFSEEFIQETILSVVKKGQIGFYTDIKNLLEISNNVELGNKGACVLTILSDNPTEKNLELAQTILKYKPNLNFRFFLVNVICNTILHKDVVFLKLYLEHGATVDDMTKKTTQRRLNDAIRENYPEQEIIGKMYNMLCTFDKSELINQNSNV